MNKLKEYSTPVYEVEMFTISNVITTSGTDSVDNNTNDNYIGDDWDF